MIYALPILIVFIAEISAGSVEGADTSKANQDGASYEASFVSRLSSQLASVLPEKSPDSIHDDPTAELGLTATTMPSTDDTVPVSIIELSEIYMYHSFFFPSLTTYTFLLRILVLLVYLLHEKSDGASFSVSYQEDLEYLLRKKRLNMRGSAAPALAVGGEAATALSIAQSDNIATQLQHLDQAQLDMDQSLNELNLILTGDSDAIESLSHTFGLRKQDIQKFLDYIDTEIDLSQDVDKLNMMIRNEIHPMLADVYSVLEEQVPEAERRLKGIFDHSGATRTETQRESHGPSGAPTGPSSQNTFPPRDHKQSFPNFKLNPKQLDHSLLKKMLKENHFAGFPDLATLFSRSGSPFVRHHLHRPQHGSIGRRIQHVNRRLDDSGSEYVFETCLLSCVDIVDETERKECNCRDLYYCSQRLKDSDFAVLFSRGLVDEETGTIQVETVNLDSNRLWDASAEGTSLFDESGNFKTESNIAFGDLYDAGQLLVMVNTIRGLALQEKCDELLDEFHVPCKDWQDGCSGSDGRTYQLVSTPLL